MDLAAAAGADISARSAGYARRPTGLTGGRRTVVAALILADPGGNRDATETVEALRSLQMRDGRYREAA
jgi:hypothetical protein